MRDSCFQGEHSSLKISCIEMYCYFGTCYDCCIACASVTNVLAKHDDVIKWKHFPRYWPFVRGIHRSPVNSPHKGQWRGALMFTLICARINGWVNNCKAGDLKRNRAHYDVIVMVISKYSSFSTTGVQILSKIDSGCYLGRFSADYSSR